MSRFNDFKGFLLDHFISDVYMSKAEETLPGNWEVRSYYNEGDYVALDVKDSSFPSERYTMDINFWLQNWSEETLDILGTELGMCGRSNGYISFDANAFQQEAYQVNDEAAKIAFEKVRHGLFEDEEDYDDLAEEYVYNMDPEEYAELFELRPEVRTLLEQLEDDASKTRQEWKDESDGNYDIF